MKDCGFKYQRFNVGLSQKGKNDLAERLFYKPTSGRIEDERDIPILIGKEISSFYHSLSPQKCLRYNYKVLNLKMSEIDKVVYSIYGLTDAEIKIIEQSI